MLITTCLLSPLPFPLTENSISFFRKGNTLSLQECGPRQREATEERCLKGNQGSGKRLLTATKDCLFVART